MTASPLSLSRPLSLSKGLGRVTMYRLVSVLLAVLAAVAFLYSATGVLDSQVFPLGHMALALDE